MSSGERCELWFAKACKPSWSSRAAAVDLTHERLNHICQRFTLLEQPLRIKALLMLLYLPKSKINEFRRSSARLLDIAAEDSESRWVRITAGLVQSWARIAEVAPGTGPGEEELRLAITQSVEGIREGILKCDGNGVNLGGNSSNRKRAFDLAFLPHECPYLSHGLLPSFLFESNEERNSHFVVRKNQKLLKSMDSDNAFTRRLPAIAGYASGPRMTGLTSGGREKAKGRSAVFGNKKKKKGMGLGMKKTTSGTNQRRNVGSKKSKMFLDIADLKDREKKIEIAGQEMLKRKEEQEEARRAGRKRKLEQQKLEKQVRLAERKNGKNKLSQFLAKYPHNSLSSEDRVELGNFISKTALEDRSGTKNILLNQHQETTSGKSNIISYYVKLDYDKKNWLVCMKKSKKKK